MNNEDVLGGLPLVLPTARIPRMSCRVLKELTAMDTITIDEKFDADIVDANIERVLKTRVQIGDEQANFQLGQIQLENHYYCSAWKNFQIGWQKYDDMRAKYQIGMMLYDEWVDHDILKQYENPRLEACRLFEEIVQLPCGPEAPISQKELVFYAAYHLARAYHQGCGYYPDEEKAIEYFKIAANDGDPNACILAQTSLGYIYSGPEHRDLKKAFYWHSEACGNGSVESQACLGVMYMHGLGVKQNWTDAIFCLSEAAQRGSIFAQGSLVFLYYKRKMFVNAAMLANKIIYRDSVGYECDTPVCINTFINRARSMACFIYAQCLMHGLGVQKDEELASRLFTLSVEYDSALAARYQLLVQHSEL